MLQCIKRIYYIGIDLGNVLGESYQEADDG